MEVSDRVNCGYPGISPQDCASRKCCFSDTIPEVPWCFFPKSVQGNVAEGEPSGAWAPGFLRGWEMGRGRSYPGRPAGMPLRPWPLTQGWPFQGASRLMGEPAFIVRQFQNVLSNGSILQTRLEPHSIMGL